MRDISCCYTSVVYSPLFTDNLIYGTEIFHAVAYDIMRVERNECTVHQNLLKLCFRILRTS